MHVHPCSGSTYLVVDTANLSLCARCGGPGNMVGVEIGVFCRRMQHLVQKYTVFFLHSEACLLCTRRPAGTLAGERGHAADRPSECRAYGAVYV